MLAFTIFSLAIENYFLSAIIKVRFLYSEQFESVCKGLFYKITIVSYKEKKENLKFRGTFGVVSLFQVSGDARGVLRLSARLFGYRPRDILGQLRR